VPLGRKWCCGSSSVRRTPHDRVPPVSGTTAHVRLCHSRMHAEETPMTHTRPFAAHNACACHGRPPCGSRPLGRSSDGCPFSAKVGGASIGYRQMRRQMSPRARQRWKCASTRPRAARNRPYSKRLGIPKLRGVSLSRQERAFDRSGRDQKACRQIVQTIAPAFP
jgi:hypothetical protein